MFEHDDPENYARAILFFDICRENEVEPHIRCLKRALGKPLLLKGEFVWLAESTRTKDKDSRFKQELFYNLD